MRHLRRFKQIKQFVHASLGQPKASPSELGKRERKETERLRPTNLGNKAKIRCNKNKVSCQKNRN